MSGSNQPGSKETMSGSNRPSPGFVSPALKRSAAHTLRDFQTAIGSSANRVHYGLRVMNGLHDKAHLWHPRRRFVLNILTKAEPIVGLVVLINFICIGLEVDQNAKQTQIIGSTWLRQANLAFTVFYVLELTSRLYAERGMFFRSAWNVFDLMIVVFAIVGGIIENAVKSVSVLRVLRLLRLMRLARLLAAFPELWLLIRDMVEAVRTLMWSAVLMLLIITVWSIFSVELLHSITLDMANDGAFTDDCEWCGSAFSSVFQSNLTLFGFVYGEGYSDLGRPLMSRHPWTAFIFFGVIFTIAFGMLNVIVAVMCENASMGREKDTRTKAKEKEDEKQKAQQAFKKICQKMDVDGDGTLTLYEILHASTDVQEFVDLLHIMDISAQDLEHLFKVLDQDDSGSVSYSEFADQLWSMKMQESRTLIVMMRYYVLQIWEKVKSHNVELHEMRTDMHQDLQQQLVDTQNEMRGFMKLLLGQVLADGAKDSCLTQAGTPHPGDSRFQPIPAVERMSKIQDHADHADTHAMLREQITERPGSDGKVFADLREQVEPEVPTTNQLSSHFTEAQLNLFSNREGWWGTTKAVYNCCCYQTPTPELRSYNVRTTWAKRDPEANWTLLEDGVLWENQDKAGHGYLYGTHYDKASILVTTFECKQQKHGRSDEAEAMQSGWKTI